MSIIQSLILGLIQGITEFLPISSSGHLILVPKIFNWTDQGLAFDTVLHLATALAIIVVLKKEIKQILFCGVSQYAPTCNNRRLLLFIILAIIPAGLIGFFFNNWIEQNLRSTLVVAISLIFWGVILWLAEYYNNRQKNKTTELKKANLKQTIIVGLMQVIALIPGTSRSGITITAGLFSKLNKQTAVKFSFLIGLPIILGAGGLKLFELTQIGISNNEILTLSVGFLSALISGLFAFKLLLWVANKTSFKIFVIYRIILGIILLLMF